MTHLTRYARTRRGLRVPLNTLTRVDGGWFGYILNDECCAVPVYVPDREED